MPSILFYLRRVRLLPSVLFGVFLAFFVAVLQGDDLATRIFSLTSGQYLPSLPLLGITASLLGLPLFLGLDFLFIPTPYSFFRKGNPLLRQGLQLLLLLFCIGLAWPSNELRTLELRTARLCALGQYPEALQVGEHYLTSSPDLVALRTYALQQQQTQHNAPLAENFFSYALPAHTRAVSLRLNASSPNIAPYYQRLITQQQQLPDTIRHAQQQHLRLLNLLLAGYLSRFAAEVPADYWHPQHTADVPRAYREALLLYTRTTPQPLQIFQDAGTLANYQDFLHQQRKLRQQYPPSNSTYSAAERNLMRQAFGTTYWYYYFYQLSAEK